MRGNKKKSLRESALIRLLMTFSNQEMTELERVVDSPYFNNQKVLSLLFKQLRKWHPEFDDQEFTREYIFSEIYKGKPYDDVTFRKHMSNLFKLTEKYLVVSDNLGNKDRYVTSLLDQFERRNQSVQFSKVIAAINAEHEKENCINNETFYYRHFREELLSSMNIRINNIHLLKPSLVNAHVYLLMHLLLTSSIYSNMMMVNRKSFHDSEESDHFTEFLKLFDIISYLENCSCLNPTEQMFVRLCKYDILLFQNPHSPENLELMKSCLLELSPNISRNLSYIFFSHLNIYYLLNTSQGNGDYSPQLFENYKYMVDNNLYLLSNRTFINFSEYRAILLSALKLKEFEWAEEFIQSFRNAHNPDLRKDIITYSYAFLNFDKGNYDDALKFLSKLSVDNVTMKLDSEALYLMIYYELNYLDSAMSVADSYSYFIRSNRLLSDEAAKNQTDFIRYVRFLAHHKFNPPDHYNCLKIRKEISDNPGVRRKAWLISKLDELCRQRSPE